jgi:hypothetical protein
MEPYWNYGRIEQIIARAVRYMSHSALDDADKTVQPYIYLSDYPTEFVFKPTKLKKILEKTTDVHLYIKSIKAQVLIDKFYGLMIEASIDCPLHIRTAPPEVQERIKCLMCAPTDTQLFHPSFDIDLKIENPCRSPAQTDVEAQEIEHDGKKYYYTTVNGISIYEYNEQLESYTQIQRDHPHYNALMEMLS